MRDRCKVGGRIQRLFPTYVGCLLSDNFKDFQFFAEWCQSQVGFGNKDVSNKCWGLDKDLLLKGNKIYSEGTCVFLPHELNCFLTKRKALRGDLPIGVCAHSTGVRAQCQLGEGRRFIGAVAHSVEVAWLQYKQEKEAYAKELADKWKHTIDPRAYEALMNYTVEITD